MGRAVDPKLILERVKKSRLPLLVSLVLIIVAFTPLKLLALVGCVVLWAVFWPFAASINSLLLRLALAFVLTNCLQQMSGFLFWLVDIRFSLINAVIVQCVVLLAAALIQNRRPMLQLISRSDIIALLVAIVSVLALVTGTLKGGVLSQQMVRQATTGFDGVQHILLTTALYDNEGYEYGTFKDLESKLLFFNMPSYPQGWSLTSSIWWHGVTDNLSLREAPTKVLLMYFSMMMAWYGVMIFLFCRLISKLVEVVAGRTIIGDVGAVAFTLLAQIMILIGVPYNSFASFYPALVVPLALTFLLVGLHSGPRVKSSPVIFLVSSLLLCGGVSFSWLLAAPAGYLAVLLGLIGYFANGLKGLILWFYKQPILIILAIILVVMGVGQGIVQLLYGVPGLVNYAGGSGVLHHLALVILLVAALLIIFMTEIAAPLRKIFAASITGIAALSGVVYIYQFMTLGQSNYFSTKITFVAFVLVTIFAGTAITILVANRVADKELSRLTGIGLLVAIVLFLPVATNMNLSTSPEDGLGSVNYAQGKRFLSEYSSSQIAILMHEKKVYQTNFVMYKHLNYAEDITTTQFMQMISRKPVPLCAQTIKGDLIAGWTLNPQTVIQCADGKDYYVMTSGAYYDDLVEAFKSHNNIKVVLSN